MKKLDRQGFARLMSKAMEFVGIATHKVDNREGLLYLCDPSRARYPAEEDVEEEVKGIGLL